MNYFQTDQTSAERKECLLWMSNSRDLNPAQDTTTRWAVSNERQECGQHGRGRQSGDYIP